MSQGKIQPLLSGAGFLFLLAWRHISFSAQYTADQCDNKDYAGKLHSRFGHEKRGVGHTPVELRDGDPTAAGDGFLKIAGLSFPEDGAHYTHGNLKDGNHLNDCKEVFDHTLFHALFPALLIPGPATIDRVSFSINRKSRRVARTLDMAAGLARIVRVF